jgi:prepilin-type N-terminal cleavage/methylation domain-containing protein
MRTRHTDVRGFTTTELMVGLVIVGIVIAAAVPNLRSYRESQRMSSACDRIAAMCRSARAKARAQNHQIVLTYDMAMNEAVLHEDANDDGVVDADENVETFALPTGVFFNSSTFTGDALVFNGRGRCLEGGSVTVDGLAHVESKRIRVSVGTGQVRVLPVDP